MKKICPTCKREYPELGNYCTKCGIALVREPNKCSANKTELCKTKSYEDDDLYCLYCGAPTTYGLKILKEAESW